MTKLTLTTELTAYGFTTRENPDPGYRLAELFLHGLWSAPEGQGVSYTDKNKPVSNEKNAHDSPKDTCIQYMKTA